MTNSHKVLVTGGAGYIGSHTVVALLDKNYEVIIVDNLSNSSLEVLDGIEEITNKKPIFYKQDITDQFSLHKIFEDHSDIVGVIHFAAAKAVGESVEKPLKYYHNNVAGMLNVLSEMEAASCSNMIFSSSCTVYGQPDHLPVDEQAPIKPAESPYGYTKQVCEAMLKDTVHASKHMKGIALRYFNPVGAHSSAKIGELPIGVPNNLVPFITQTGFGIRDSLKVFGNDYNTHDGTCVRDYIHVVDLARAHIVALERLIKQNEKESFEFFNLGTGKGSTVLDVIKAFEKASGQKLNYQFVQRRAGDIEKIYADTTFANEELGWKTQYDLDEMMASAWAWENKYRRKTSVATR